MGDRFVGIPELGEVPAVAVVVDVMRAFTVAAWLLGRGAVRIVLASSESDALALKARYPDWLAVKDGPPAPGFDAVNSPGLVAELDVAGRTVVQKTTAGTVGALAVADAPLVLCASFVVAGATARFLREHAAAPVTFVVTGESGQADEDLACAEYIGRRVTADDVDPTGYVDRARKSRAAADLAAGVRRGFRGIHPDDVALCLEVDRFPFAMTVRRDGAMAVLERA